MADSNLYSAFLIGSWDHDPSRQVRYGDNRIISKKIDKKRGIRKTMRKGQEVPKDEWVKGDLRVMEDFMGNRNIETFCNFDYRERDPVTGRYAIGKHEILRKLQEFFEQPYKTHFILYFTGHGDEDGSWCFPVTIKNLELAPPRSGSTHPPPPHPGPTPTAAATPGVVTLEETGDETTVYPISSDTSDPESTDEPRPKQQAPAQSYNLRLSQSIESLCPDPTKELYDLLTFEEIVKLWDAHKKVRKRYLMLILDCCHSGRWVQMANGYSTSANVGEDNEGTAAEGTPPKVYLKRDDICVQAACRPIEESSVAGNQMGSIFTNAYIAAQNRGLVKNLALTALDHIFVLNVASIVACSHAIFDSSKRFTPMSAPSPKFNGFKFFDSFGDMHLQTD